LRMKYMGAINFNKVNRNVYSSVNSRQILIIIGLDVYSRILST